MVVLSIAQNLYCVFLAKNGWCYANKTIKYGLLYNGEQLSVILMADLMVLLKICSILRCVLWYMLGLHIQLF